MLLRKAIFIIMVFLALICHTAQSQDTIRLSLQDAERQFLQNNLALIAEKYNIDINKAATKQAKIWDNPEFSFASNIYDGNKYPFYHAKSNAYGQFDLEWMQLFKVANQRKKLANVLNDNVLIAEQQFDDMMNSLRYTLKTDMFMLAGLLEMQKNYNEQLQILLPFASAMQIQLHNGNISAKDNLRINALVYELQSTILDNDKSIADIQIELSQLLQLPIAVYVIPLVELEKPLFIDINAISLDSLVALAKENRPDYKIAQLQTTQQEHNLIYQKALAKPNVSAGLAYSSQGSYVNNLVSFQLSIPIPFFDRNQSSIKMADIGIKQQKVQADLLASKIQNEINGSIKKLSLSFSLQTSKQTEFSEKYKDMLSKMLQSYKSREISLLDFIDFISAYNTTKQQQINQIVSIKNNIEELNYACATKVIDNN